MDATNYVNKGLLTRKCYVAGSRIVDMMGRLHVDLFFQDRYLLNGVDVKIRLVQNKNAFALMAGEDNPDYKIGIDDWKVFSIPGGAMYHTHESVYLGVLPKRVVLSCVDNDAYKGTFAKNPFHAKHNKLNVDGQQVPAKPLQPKCGADDTYVRRYLNLFAGKGKMFQDEGNNITRQEFSEGYPCLLLKSHRIFATVPISIWYIKATCDWKCISMFHSSRRSTSSST